MRISRAAFAVLIVASLVVATTAYAEPQLPVAAGGVAVKFADWTALVRNGVPVTSGVPQAGDEGRSIFYATSMLPNNIPLTTTPNGFPFWTASAAEELTGMTYDFVVPGSANGKFWEFNVVLGYVNTGNTGVVNRGVGRAPDTYFISGPRLGGRFDIWTDKSPDFFGTGGTNMAQQGPAGWITGSPHDNYAGVSDLATDGVSIDPNVTLYATGTYVPLFVDFNGDLYRDAGEPDQAFWDPNGDDFVNAGGLLIDPSGDDIAAVSVAQGALPGLGGNVHSWIDITGGYLYDTLLMTDHLDNSGNPYDYDMYFESTLRPGSDNWPNNSSDPVIFAVIPEPMTISLVASVMLGTIAASRRRKK